MAEAAAMLDLLKDAIGTGPIINRVLEKRWIEVTSVTGIIETNTLVCSKGILNEEKYIIDINHEPRYGTGKIIK